MIIDIFLLFFFNVTTEVKTKMIKSTTKDYKNIQFLRHKFA